MVDLAAQLVDRVFPASVPVRQWVLSAPWDLRVLLARDPHVLSQLLRVFHDEVERGYLARVSTDLPGTRRGAAVSMIQRFSGSLGMNVHDHSAWVDGIYVVPPGDAPPTILAAPPPTHEQIAHVAERVCRRFKRWLRRKKLIDDRPAQERSNEMPEPDALTSLLFAGSLRGTLALVPDSPAGGDDPCKCPTGDRAGSGGHDDEKQHARFDAQARRRSSKWAANVEGFSVHAGTTVAADNRFGLEQLLRYGLRPGVSLERLSRLADGRFVYRMKHCIGLKTHRIMEPMELMARLASIVAPPRYPLLRYYGLFAPGCRLRTRVVPSRPANRARCCAAHELQRAVATSPATPPASPTDRASQALIERAVTLAGANSVNATCALDAVAAPPPDCLAGGTRIPWADLMRHGFNLDVLRCPRCSSGMHVVAVVQDRAEARRYLAHVGIPPSDSCPERSRRDVPQRAWDPVPFDPPPPDDWVA